MRRLLIASVFLCLSVLSVVAQDVDVRANYDRYDRLLKVSQGDKIDLKVDELVGIYSDTDDIVDRYDAAFNGAYLERAYVFFSDGTVTKTPDNKYIRINLDSPSEDLNSLCGLKPTSGYIDMKIYYVITYYDKKYTPRIASGEYGFKVRVVNENGEAAKPLQSISLPEKVSVGRGLHYLLTPTIKPEGAAAALTWSSSDNSIVYIVPDSDVYILGRKEGVAVVTVTTDDGKQASTEVTVKPQPELMKDYDLTTTFWHMTKGVTNALQRL